MKNLDRVLWNYGIPTLMIGGTLGVIGGIIISLQCTTEELKRAYEEGNRIISGKVLEERYENTLSSVPEKEIRGLISHAYSSETVKLDSKYTLRVQTDDGRILGVSIVDAPDVRKESLDILINAEKQTRISFYEGNLVKTENNIHGYEVLDNETYFTPETQFGNKRADRIRLEPQPEKQ